MPGGKYHNPKRYAARIDNRARPSHRPTNGETQKPHDPQTERRDAIAHAKRMVALCEDRPELLKYWQQQLDELQSNHHEKEEREHDIV